MGRWASIRARLSALPPDRVLAAVAALFGVLQVVEVALADDPGRRGVALVFAVLTVVPLARAWRAPLAAVLAYCILDVVEGALGGHLLKISDAAGFVAVIYVLVLALRADRRRFAFGVAATLGLLWAAVVIEGEPDVLGAMVWIVVGVIGPAAVGGRMLRSHNALNRRLREQTAELELNRAERERAAVLAERTRIARELHDVVAHDVSVMLVQAEAAKRMVHANADLARGAIAAVEDTGREALGELRRLLGVLRRGDEELALAPQPSLARVAALVGRMRAAGLAVNLEVSGDPVRLAPGIDAAAFRVVQEALVNVVRHARAGSAAVRVAYLPETVELVVSDDGIPASSVRESEGLVGLRERVALYGGELRAGPRRPRGYELRARLPVGAAA